MTGCMAVLAPRVSVEERETAAESNLIIPGLGVAVPLLVASEETVPGVVKTPVCCCISCR